MNLARKEALFRRYAGVAGFLRDATDEELVWGVADLFGYESPRDSDLLNGEKRQLLALSFYVKEFWSSGIDAAIERLGAYWPAISSGLREFGGETTRSVVQQINALMQAGHIDVTNEDDAYAFVSAHGYFEEETRRMTAELPVLLNHMRNRLAILLAE